MIYRENSHRQQSLLILGTRAEDNFAQLEKISYPTFNIETIFVPHHLSAKWFSTHPEVFAHKSSMNVNRSMRNPYDLKHHRPNQVTFGSKSLRPLGPQVWNSLSNEIKSTETLKAFKQIMKQWNGIQCTCNVCQYDMPLRS